MCRAVATDLARWGYLVAAAEDAQEEQEDIQRVQED
jgi:hypothetical protein